MEKSAFTEAARTGNVARLHDETAAAVATQAGLRPALVEAIEGSGHEPAVMKGYHNLPGANEEAFIEDGYCHTGDVARRDSDNYYEIIDRKKHMINTAGRNVYPSEVEEPLYEHPAVEDVVGGGVPDDRRGETVKAVVVPAADTDPSADEHRQFCLDDLAEYKHPREIEFVGELSRAASGKVQKFKLTPDDSGA